MATINGTFVTKSIDTSTSFLYDRREVVTGPLWSTGKSYLDSIYTSSNQPHHQKIYYKNIFSNNQSTQSLDVEFSISYGNFYGSGSSTGSYGLISGSGSGWNKLSVTESMAIYSQYRNLLLDYDKREYLSNGKFRFFGNTDTDIGLYVFGNFRNNSYDGIYYTPHKIKLPNIKYGSPLNKIKTITYAKYQDKTQLNLEHLWYAIDISGKLYVNQDSGYSEPLMVDDGPWKDVSISWANNNYHFLSIKEDGSLWAGGNNTDGQLGLGYAGGTVNDLVKVGLFNDWEKVYTGHNFSLGLRNGGKLYAWGNNSTSQLGLGDQISRTSPTLVGNNTWKKIVISNLDYNDIVNLGMYSTIIGIDTDGKLWAWGDDRTDTLFTPSTDGTPILLNSDTDWKDVSVGREFVITIKGDDNEMYAWGYGGDNGEFFGDSSYQNTFYTFDQRQLISTIKGWKYISSGVDFTIGIGKLSDIYGWGKNDVNQLSIDTTPNDYANAHTPLSNDLIGWDNISCGAYHSIGAINIPNKNAKTVVSDDIYVINVKRHNFRDRVDSGTWQLSLDSVDQNLITSNDVISLVDETTVLTETNNQNPMYDTFSKGGVVYNIYQGTIDGGINRSSKDFPYGLFFPENGIIILNGETLSSNDNNWSSIETKRTPATSSGAFPFSSNAEMLYTSISGAMHNGYEFIAKTVEVKNPTYCFIRINNEEFNHTLNRSYYSKPDTYLVKESLKTVPYPFTYITTIGLYNDSGDLLAVAKTSRPIKKTPSTELVIKVKLDI